MDDVSVLTSRHHPSDYSFPPFRHEAPKIKKSNKRTGGWMNERLYQRTMGRKEEILLRR
jgi:hypothetical protein